MPDSTTPAQEATQTAAQEAAATTTQTGSSTAASQAPADVASLPEWAQSVIKDLQKENAKRRKDEQSREAATKAAEEAKLAESQQWQQLAEKREKEIATLAATAERYKALSAEITTALEAEIATWPDEVKALRPADADAAGLLVWAKGARPLAAKLTAAPTTHATGQAPAPKPAGNGVVDAAKRQAQTFAQVKQKF